MKIESLKTSKLFYNKWPYKIECRLKGSYKIDIQNINRTLSWCKSERGESYQSSIAEREEIAKFTNYLKDFLQLDIKFRVEYNTFSFFCQDIELFDQILNKFDNWIVRAFKPASDQELEYIILHGNKKRVCTHLPRHKYQYKILLHPSMSPELGKRFSTWAQNYGDKISIPPTTRLWFEGKRFYIQSPFLYVDDGQMLSMAGMYLGNSIRTIEEFVLRDSINTTIG